MSIINISIHVYCSLCTTAPPPNTINTKHDLTSLMDFVNRT